MLTRVLTGVQEVVGDSLVHHLLPADERLLVVAVASHFALSDTYRSGCYINVVAHFIFTTRQFFLHLPRLA